MEYPLQLCCTQCGATLTGTLVIKHTAPDSEEQAEKQRALATVLPERIAHRYAEAWRVHSSSPTACAILIGNILEAMCAEEHIQGVPLPEKLRVFAQRKRLPQILVDIAHDLRYLRNIGSHESEETILSEDIPAMLNGLEALVAYVYLLPFQQAALAARSSTSQREAGHPHQ
jgi:hypothetical protein